MEIFGFMSADELWNVFQQACSNGDVLTDVENICLYECVRGSEGKLYQCRRYATANGYCSTHMKLFPHVKSKRFKATCDRDDLLYSEDGKKNVKLYHAIAELKYGRARRSDEHVHHIDGNSSNHCPTNLQLVPGTLHMLWHQHTHGRVPDEVLNLYQSLIDLIRKY